MSEQSNLSLAQKAVEQHRELGKTLSALYAGAIGAEPPAAKGALIRFLDDYVRGWNERTPDSEVSVPAIGEVLALAGSGGVVAGEMQHPRRYYALSSGRGPNQIYFDEVTAKEMGAKFGNYFLDVLDEKGWRIASWEYTLKPGTVERTWTIKP